MFPAIQRLFRPEMRWAWRELEKYIDGKVNRALEVLAMILVAYDGALADPGRRQDEIRRCRAIAEKARELGELIAATDMDKRYRGQLAWTHSWGVIPRPPHTLRALRPEIGTFLSREGRLGDSPGDALSTLIGLGVAEVADLQARVEEKLARLVPSPGIGKASRERTAFIRLLGMCQAPCDHVPRRSYPLFLARDVLRTLREAVKRTRPATRKTRATTDRRPANHEAEPA